MKPIVEGMRRRFHVAAAEVGAAREVAARRHRHRPPWRPAKPTSRTSSTRSSASCGASPRCRCCASSAAGWESDGREQQPPCAAAAHPPLPAHGAPRTSCPRDRRRGPRAHRRRPAAPGDGDRRGRRPGLRHAIVYFDTLAAGADDDIVLEALAKHRPRLQSAIARQTRFKRTPELAFRPDDVARQASRLEEIIREPPRRRGWRRRHRRQRRPRRRRRARPRWLRGWRSSTSPPGGHRTTSSPRPASSYRSGASGTRARSIPTPPACSCWASGG